MKHKFKVVGALAYFGLFVLSALVCFEPSLVPLCYALPLLGTLVLSTAFFLKYTDRASVMELTAATVVSYGLLVALVCRYIGLSGCLILSAIWAIIWSIAAVGIWMAVIVAKKWTSPHARRLVRWVVPATVLLVAAGCSLYELAAFWSSVRAAGGFSPPALECNADELHSTRVVPELEVPITLGTNLVWCAPFQLAWNDMMELIGEEIHFAGDEPDFIARLNQRSVAADFLGDESYIAFAGDYTPSFVEEMNRSIEKKFGRGAFPEVETPSDGEARLAAFGYLSMNLPFQYAFQRTEDPMSFNGVSVESFTIPFGPNSNRRAERAERQVSVMYPPEEESFIVELATQRRDHHLILARVVPEKTLAATVDKVCGYTDSLERRALETNQRLEVPLFNFSIERDYSELTGQTLDLERSDYDGWQIEKAHQKIRFQLDERGAILRSESFISAVFGLPPTHCIFDQPFLLMLCYEDRPQPYFAMWVDNAEILVHP